MPDESSDKSTATDPSAPATGPSTGETEDGALDPMSPEAIAKRVAALGGEDEIEKIARDEEIKLAERRAKAGGGKKKGGLEAAASKRLQAIGKAVPAKRVAIAADANPLLANTGELGKWIRQNQSFVTSASIVLLVAILGGGGYVWWTQRAESGASTTITEAVDDENGRIGDPAKEEDEDTRPQDAHPIFKTEVERRDAALAKYREVETKYKGTGAAYLARLEEGSLLLDKADLDGAIAAFEDASKSPLGAADSEVKGRALEGLGLAYEAKAKATPAEKDKWLDQAAQEFHALENTDVKGFKELGMYHEARVAEAKGDKDKAVTTLKALHERLDQPGENHPFVYLETVADDRLRDLDPTAIKPKPKGQLGGPGGNNMSQEQINKLIEQLKAQHGQGGEVTDRSIAFAAIVASLVSVASCATTETANDRVNPEVPLWFNRPNGAIHVYLDRALTAPSRQIGEDYEHGRPAIDPIHGRVFVGSADRGLYALRASDGDTIWRFETLGVVQCEPLYDPKTDLVYFGSHDGALYAVQARDGRLVWRFMTGAEVARQPVIGGPDGSMLFVANGADQLFGLERATGKQMWTVHRTPALGMEIAQHAGPAVDGDMVYMAYSDGHVIAYGTCDGAEKWTPVDLSADAEQTLGDAPRYLDVDTTPIVDELPAGKVVYVASYAGGVFALDAKSGARVWMNEKAIGATELTLWREAAHVARTSNADGLAPLVPAKRVLIASSGVSGLWGLDPMTGRKLWRVPVPEGGITAPAAIAGALLVGTTRYGLFLVSPINGRPIDGVDLGSGFAETPAAYGSRAFVISNAGTFLGVKIDDPAGR